MFGVTEKHLEMFHTRSGVRDDGTNNCNSVRQAFVSDEFYAIEVIEVYASRPIDES